MPFPSTWDLTRNIPHIFHCFLVFFLHLKKNITLLSFPTDLPSLPVFFFFFLLFLILETYFSHHVYSLVFISHESNAPLCSDRIAISRCTWQILDGPLLLRIGDSDGWLLLLLLLRRSLLLLLLPLRLLNLLILLYLRLPLFVTQRMQFVDSG